MASMFKLTRVFRSFVKGVPQISDFPEENPEAAPGKFHDLEVRMKHFTEIENFTFLGYVLAHELSGPLELISTIQHLTVADPEFQALIDRAKPIRVTPERLGDELLDVGINWEHFVASTNDLAIDKETGKAFTGDPLTLPDQAFQDKIDALDEISEALVAEINLRARRQHHHGHD